MLQINQLAVEYRVGNGSIRALNCVDLAIAEGETVGVVGESGCGKSTLAKAILRLLPSSAHIISGSILLGNESLLDLGREQMRRKRWRDVSFIPQNALSALNPVLRIGDQIGEAIYCHERVSSHSVNQRIKKLFDLVGLPTNRIGAYPHEFSGGMRQRAVLAAALALNPKLIVADEPTTALDVITQRQILDRMSEIQREHRFALLLITHDLGVARGVCDRLVIMYAGEVVEIGSVANVLRAPAHPYTDGLMSAAIVTSVGEGLLKSIPGHPPSGASLAACCQFADRCGFAVSRCRTERPSLSSTIGGRDVACHRADEPSVRAALYPNRHH